MMDALRGDPGRPGHPPRCDAMTTAAVVAHRGLTGRLQRRVPKLVQHTAWLTLGQFGGQAATAVLFLVIARSFGPGRFGIVMAGYGLAMIAMDVLDFGGTTHLLVRLSTDGASEAEYLRVLASRLWLGLGTVLAAAAVDVVASPAPRWLIPSFALVVFAKLMTVTVAVPLRAAQRFGVVAAATVTERVAALAVALAAVLLGSVDLRIVPVAVAIGSTVALGVLWRELPIEFRRSPLTWPGNPLRVLRIGVAFGVTGLLTDLVLADVSVVAAIAGPAQAGLFAAPARLTGPLLTVSTSFANAIMPDVAAGRDSARLRTTVARAGALVGGPVAAVLAGVGVFAPLIVPHVLGPAFTPSVPLVRLYCASALLVSLTQPMAAFLQAAGQQRFVAATVGPCALLCINGVGAGAAWHGAFGASFAYLLVNALLVLILVARLRHRAGTPTEVSLTGATGAVTSHGRMS